MEGAFAENTGKLGIGVLRYSENEVVCLIDSQSVGRTLKEVSNLDLSIPIVDSVGEARDLGADVLILGIAPPGGQIPVAWFPHLKEAIHQGMSLVNGLHQRLSSEFDCAFPGQFIWDVRVEPEGLTVGAGRARLLCNRRVLMVGSDMSVGKMTAGLELWKVARARGIKAEFVATGQTGMIIMGSGIPLDAIKLDYATGAVEREVCKYEDSELVIIEGQGSLIHPGSSATLPLMRGSCPTHLVFCHRPGMTNLPRIPWVQVPPLKSFFKLVEDLGSAFGNFPVARVYGLCLNTGHLAEDQAIKAISEYENELKLPVCDPVRSRPEALLDAIMA